MAVARVDLSAFPRLRLNAGDVTGSFRSWMTQFEIAVEVTTINLGDDNDGNARFRGRTKLLALLSAIGSDGVETLQSLGFDVARNEDNAYDEALALMRTHYQREESFYVKTMKFVTASQACGEDEREYLLRVEKLSRTMGFGAQNNELRQRFAVAIAVNGLNESEVRKEMMAQANLTWEQLSARLRARTVARESETIVSEAKAGQFNVRRNIKTEVANVEASERLGGLPGDSDSSTAVSWVSGNARESRRRFDSPKREKSRNKYRSRSSSVSSNDSIGRSGNERRGKHCSPSGSYRPTRRYYSPGRDNRCFQCKKEGHRVRNCPDVYCFTCNGKGHTSKDCPNRYVRSSKGYKSYRKDSRESSGSRSPKSHSVRFAESKSCLYGSDNSIRRMLRANNRPVEFTFDTGAEVSVITEKTSKTLGLELTKPKKGLTGADGSKLNVAGMSKVCIKSTFRSVNALVYVLRGSGRNLLGLPEIRSLNLLGRKMAIVKRKGEECDSGSANEVRTGTPLYASAVAGRSAP